MNRLARLLGAVTGDREGVGRREALGVLGLVGLALAIRMAVVLLTTGEPLVGDEPEYDLEGRFIADGKWFWSTTPYGNPHPSLWKTPGYPTVVGVVYGLFGTGANRVIALQTLVGGANVALTWALGRRMFGPPAGLAAAAIVAVNPFVWAFEVRLLAEALVTTLMLLFFLMVVDRPATAKRAAAVGAVVGISILFRPSALYLLPAAAAVWLVVAGWKRGAVLTALTVLLAALVVAPWTIRNYDLSGGFVPFSIQDAALYGVFNDTAANDPDLPYAWRYRTERDRDIIEAKRPLSDLQFRSILRERALAYIREHPDSVPKAFFWNGLSRLWDVRRPSHILGDARATGRERAPAIFAVGLHFLLLPLALAGLWLARRRPELVLPILAAALSASVIYTTDAETRYRVPFEPLIAIFAAFAAIELWRRRTAARAAV